MPMSLYSLLLLSALVVYYTASRATARPRIDRCPQCGDLVQHVPGWLIRCPSCHRAFIA